jgi:hypothetical protein
MKKLSPYYLSHLPLYINKLKFMFLIYFIIFLLMLSSLIIIFLFIFVATYLRVKVECPYYTKANFLQERSDLLTWPCLVSSMGIHKPICSSKPSSGKIVNNNQGTESPGDPKNNPKKDKTKNSENACRIKTPVFPGTPAKVYDDAKNSKLDMLSDLKNQAVIYM